MDDRVDRASRSLNQVFRTADRLARRMGGEFVPDQNGPPTVTGSARREAGSTRR